MCKDSLVVLKFVLCHRVGAEGGIVLVGFTDDPGFVVEAHLHNNHDTGWKVSTVSPPELNEWLTGLLIVCVTRFSRRVFAS